MKGKNMSERTVFFSQDRVISREQEENKGLRELSEKLEKIAKFQSSENVWQDVGFLLELTKVKMDIPKPLQDLSATDILFLLQALRQDLWRSPLEDHGFTVGPLALLAQHVRSEEIRLTDETMNHYLNQSAEQLGLSGANR